MKLGLIGNPLGHSWSPEIHRLLTGYEYSKWPLEEKELAPFLEKHDFTGINVTIPYKKAVIPYLDEMDDTAAALGAVNCIVVRDGKLKGYNTDLTGFMRMMERNSLDVSGGLTAVLGSGGASKACMEGVRRLGGKPVTVSRTPKNGAIGYDELYARESEFTALVNATPVGMLPDTDSVPVDLAGLHHLKAVADIIANPLMTRLQFEAHCRGIPSAGGFEMLVRQAAAADLLFTGREVMEETVRSCMKTLLNARRNIVLIGMPTSGKTTLAEMLSARTGRRKVEMDDVLVERLGMPISTCFEKYGEAYFRSQETQLAKELRRTEGTIISCGGGIIKNADNMRFLHENGIVIWVDRDPSLLYPTDSRPLSSTENAVLALYRERKDLYQKYSDVAVANNGAIEDTLQKIIRITGEN